MHAQKNEEIKGSPLSIKSVLLQALLFSGTDAWQSFTVETIDHRVYNSDYFDYKKLKVPLFCLR